jgi:hypothetical protein
VRPAPKRIQNSEQASPFNYYRFNVACVCTPDGGVFQNWDVDVDDASEVVLRKCAGAVWLRLLRGEHGRGGIP